MNITQTSGHWPRVTIVTPSYNQGQYIEETIKSVITQDYPNLEYIIIDGGSTDNSVEIIQKYDKWIKFWISEPDKGQADAINKGFQKSSGDYIGWLNSDDILYPAAIHRVIEEFLAYPDVDLIYGDNEQGLNLGPESRPLFGSQIEFSQMLRTLQVPIPQLGSLWKRTVIDQIGNLDIRWQVILDREFFTRAAQRCRLRYLPGVLGFFRNHEHSKSILLSRIWLSELPLMYSEFFNRVDLSKDLKNLRGETMGAMFLTCASIAYQCGEIRLAAIDITRAITYDPLIIFRQNTRKKLFALFRSLLPIIKIQR
jgi:glycosyltransferase involved in cell wall biosynthesis